MKYIHGGTLKDKTPANAIVRVIFGFLLAILALIGFISGHAVGIVYGLVVFGPGAFLLLFFGFRTIIKRSKTYPRHNPYVINSSDINNPFFTTECSRCGMIFDYQHSDLGYRAWYRDGYVACPRCRQPIRHNAITNKFKVDEVDFYDR